MARKSIKGYAEKNYYDNTRFSGGIVATNDPLNEGYFKHLVNFDISDTGQSLIPRKGFLTTTFKKDTNTYTFDKDLIYFYDESLGEYIFFTFKGGEFNGVRCKFDTIKDNYFSEINVINQNLDENDNSNNPLGCDTSFIRNGLGITSIIPSYSNHAIRVVDDNNIINYVIHVTITFVDHTRWNKYLKIYYRKNESTEDYKEDTLVLEYLDMDQIVNYVDPNYRNLASGTSIIPNPIQKVYKKGEHVPSEHYDRLPMMYVRNNEGKYLINEVKDSVNNLTLVPNFYIKEISDDDFYWAYTYEFFSTDALEDFKDSKTTSYKGLIYDLNTNEPLSDIDTLINYTTYTITQSLEELLTEYNPYVTNYNLREVGDFYSGASIPYDDYVNYLQHPEIKSTDYTLPEYIIYITPRYANDSFVMDLYEWSTGSGRLGPWGIFTLFQYYKWITNHDGADIRITNEIHAKGNLCSDTYTARIYPEAISTQLHELTYDNLENFFEYIFKYNYGIYISSLNDAGHFGDGVSKGFQNCIETALGSSIYSWDYAPLTYFNDTLRSIINNRYSVTIRVLPFLSQLNVYVSNAKFDYNRYPILNQHLFTDIDKIMINDRKNYYWAFDACKQVRDSTGSDTHDVRLELYSIENLPTFKDTTIENLADLLERMPEVDQIYRSIFYSKGPSNVPNTHDYLGTYPIVIPREYLVTMSLKSIPKHFEYNGNTLCSTVSTTNSSYKYLYDRRFFETGLNIVFYLLKLPKDSVIEANDIVKSRENLFNNAAKLSVSRLITCVQQDPTTYIEQLTEDPNTISSVKNSISYTSILGSHLILYTGNKVYISEPGQQYYFTQFNKFEYPEPVVKVIQYKEILLVFTTQNLYAIHLEEFTKQVENGTNEDGSTKYTQEVSYEFRSHTVLYNLMVNEKYADAIQVYNQMVLFYSADGQMFLIKPTAAITSDTRFSIQYFNKSANDILLNYKDYIQRRLQDYGLDDTVDNVDIKVLANINYIKIFYSTDKITYILVYDVNNNRYFVYDTIAFSNIKYLHYIPSGELYIVSGRGDDTNLYFTIPYTDTNMVDNNVDISYYDYFSPYEINAEIDTGVINLNNHLKKRFKDLHVIYKNLNANNVSFSLETYVDDVPIITYINSTFEVRNVSSFDTLVVVDNNNVVQLIRPEDQLIDNTALFSFIDYTSNKIITHKTNIVSKGKTIRIKMKYRSKGKYKIQGFGLIYKEHTV